MTFILSAILGNLTTTIVMVTLMRKLLDRGNDRLLFASVIVIAANAGGAWSPMGDVTTTMLWIGGQISALGIIEALLPASVVNLLVPLLVVSVAFSGKPFARASASPEVSDVPAFERNLMLMLGLGLLIVVPAFKQVTHLPPFMGILFGLGSLWCVGEILYKGKPPEALHKLTLAHALTGSTSARYCSSSVSCWQSRPWSTPSFSKRLRNGLIVASAVRTLSCCCSAS